MDRKDGVVRSVTFGEPSMPPHHTAHSRLDHFDCSIRYPSNPGRQVCRLQPNPIRA
ncbi:hypothetical protein ZHAS_00002732 [Anopheles sinensis]|uniref:Uncharacterized protein n=1 Tax=Anopheles sinensis TaxID=74873 RepID=A0A084VCW4_ANOSI|nr:hypothetical protein ZHAS_00002732 [Anopheles sinensis]